MASAPYPQPLSLAGASPGPPPIREVMGIEILRDDTTLGQAKVIEGDETSLPEMDSKPNSNSEQGHEDEVPNKFGLEDSSHGVNGETKETGSAIDANVPKDAVDEWPAPKQIHVFYFVRVRSYEDPRLKGKIEQADKDIQKKNQARFQIIEALRAKRSERANLISQLKPLTSEDRQYRMVIDEKRKEMEPLQAALGKLRGANNASREKGVGLCSSEEELNNMIRSLHFLIQHESNTLVEEKQLLKEIKQLEASREKVIANTAIKTKIQDSVGHKDAIQDQVKLIGVDMDEVRKEKQAVRNKIKNLEEELKAVNDEIKTLEEELDAITNKREEAYAAFSELRKMRGEVNAPFYQNRSLLNSAKDLAAKKDITTLEKLSQTQVETFMSEYSSSKAFRDDYERRILSSLDSRQLSRDGRMRNPDEKPIIEPRPISEPEMVPMKVDTKRVEDTFPPSRLDAFSIHKAHYEMTKSTEVELRGKPGRPEDFEDIYELGKSRELLKPCKIDAAKAKDMKREEEISKAKLAIERKKKLAEKAAAKAAARAQKDAEKKIKKEEKRAKKKAGISELAVPTEQTETDTKSSEPEEDEVKVDAPVPVNTKKQNEKTRYRGRLKVVDPLPKVILKRKKSQSYWSWAAPVIVAVLLVVVGYSYVGMN